MIIEQHAAIPRYALHEETGAALTDVRDLHIIGKSLFALYNAGSTRLEIVSGAYQDSIVDSTDLAADKGGNVYSTILAAKAAGHKQIFVKSAADTLDLTIASGDAVQLITGDSTINATIPVNVTSEKLGVSFQFLTFSSKYLDLNAARNNVVGCLFTGTITPGSALLNGALAAGATSIPFDGGTGGGLPTQGYAYIKDSTSAFPNKSQEIVGYISGGDATSGTLSLNGTHRRGMFQTRNMAHVDNTPLTDMTKGHLIIRGNDCQVSISQFVSCVDARTHAVLIRGAKRTRIVSSSFLSNTTWGCVTHMPLQGLGSEYGFSSISACSFDSNINEGANIDTFLPLGAATVQEDARGVQVANCVFTDFNGVAIRPYGILWNLGNLNFIFSASTDSTVQINQVGGISATDSTWPYDTIVQGTLIPNRGLAFIDSEVISYFLIGTEFVGCLRGVNGTTAATHADNAVITFINRVGIMSQPQTGSLSSATPNSVSTAEFFRCNNPVYGLDTDTQYTATAPWILSNCSIVGGDVTGSQNWFYTANHWGSAVTINLRSKTGQFIGPSRGGSVTFTNIASDTQFQGGALFSNLASVNIVASGKFLSLGRIAGDTGQIGLVQTNRTGATSVVGNVVVFDGANADSVVNAGIVAVSTLVAGTVLNAVANLSDVSIAVEGEVTVNCDTGAVAINDRLGTSLITAGLAATNAAPLFNTYFAIARTAKAAGANGSVKAVLRLQ